ncbi:DNA-directed RNA polymerase subunit omega [Paenibacillus senegalensis]|uniref:DNA-directed RNA polymerase subunit omega n=1 Tax=Paenibacillus senegalensis TaxID=1465766 RepID=UPI000289CB9B|nr:DNA-directed RNA polymerase subunit omega [Paenibacillus senegalensis]
MLYPSIDKLLNKVDSKYSLVVAAAKRARMLKEGVHSQLEQPQSHKHVGVALEELYGDYIHYEKIENKNE